MAEMTRRAFSGLAAVNVMCPLLAPRTVQAQAANQLSLDRYELKFDSDFEPLGRVADKTPGTGDTVNGSQWTPRYRFTNDPRGCSFHGEYQWYVDPRFDWGPGIGHISPFSVSSRELAITARRTPAGLAAKMAGRLDQEKRETNVPHPWISGVITTQNSFWFRYGYAEAMVKLPRGRTLWPAFWMLPKEWPYPPEVDIMEFIGDEPRKSNYNVIAGTPDKPMDGRGDYSDRGLDLTLDWHSFGCLWTPEAFEFFLDRKKIGSVPAHPTMDQCHYYLILNMAVGGKWPGVPGADTPSPAEFRVRHVKVWQLIKPHTGLR